MENILKLSVSFQSKVGDGVECTPDVILLHSSDMKSLKVKLGSIVFVELPTSFVLCRAWTSKKAVSGSATLNKLWYPNFPSDQRKIKVSTLNAESRLSKCKIAYCSVKGAVPKTTLDNNTFKTLVLNMLSNTYIRAGLCLSLTYLSESFNLQVEYCTSELDNPVENTFYVIKSDTILNFGTADSANNENKSVMGGMRGSADLDQLERVVGQTFVGYSEEVRDALGITSLGLHGSLYNRADININEPPEAGLSKPPKGLILYGAPGTGKTTLMHAIVTALGCNSIELSHNILLSRYEGDAERTVTRIFAEAAAKAPCCILIDNMDLLCYSRTAAGASELQKRLVSCLLTLMDGVGSPQSAIALKKGSVFVIGTTARVSDIDIAVRRAGRIDKEIEIGVPSALDRQSILLGLLARTGVEVSALNDSVSVKTSSVLTEKDVRSVAQQAHGMVGADLLAVVKEAFFLSMKDSRHISRDDTSIVKLTAPVVVEDNEDTVIGNLADEFATMGVETDQPDIHASAAQETKEPSNLTTAYTTGTNSSMSVITVELLRRAVSRVSPSALREVVIEVPAVRWTDIGGMEGVKQSLREVVEWPLQRPELFASLGISPPKGVLLYGPPGCSKTLMAKALATESSMNFLAVRGPELLSKWLGESEKAVQSLFRRARAAAPSIVFFDEIDALAGKRGDVSSGVSDRVLSQLLTELDGVQGLKQVIVIAATNRPDMLDAALVRPGRIDRKIYVPPPDEDSRSQILQLELGKMPLQDEINLLALVQCTAGFSGAEIVGVCSEAAMLAIEAGEQLLRPEHLFTAIASVKPQITEEMLQFYQSCVAKL